MRGRGGLRTAFAALLLVLCIGRAGAAELGGVTFPDTVTLDGSGLRLNGMAVRAVSFLHVHIYVSALYLQQLSHDGEAILDSSEKKLLEFHFVHDADAARIRDAWREGFARNCVAPCTLAPADVARFLAGVTDQRAGDVSAFAWANGRLTIKTNGKVLGVITEPAFARAVLATSIGPHPVVPSIKQGLLGLGN